MVAKAIYSVTMVLWKETTFPLCRQNHEKASGKECCLPGVFRDSGDTPANLLCVSSMASCFYDKWVEDYYHNYYAAFKAPCAGHKDDESQAVGGRADLRLAVGVIKRFWFLSKSVCSDFRELTVTAQSCRWCASCKLALCSLSSLRSHCESPVIAYY